MVFQDWNTLHIAIIQFFGIPLPSKPSPSFIHAKLFVPSPCNRRISDMNTQNGMSDKIFHIISIIWRFVCGKEWSIDNGAENNTGNKCRLKPTLLIFGIVKRSELTIVCRCSRHEHTHISVRYFLLFTSVQSRITCHNDSFIKTCQQFARKAFPKVTFCLSIYWEV